MSLGYDGGDAARRGCDAGAGPESLPGRLHPGEDPGSALDGAHRAAVDGPSMVVTHRACDGGHGRRGGFPEPA